MSKRGKNHTLREMTNPTPDPNRKEDPFRNFTGLPPLGDPAYMGKYKRQYHHFKHTRRLVFPIHQIAHSCLRDDIECAWNKSGDSDGEPLTRSESQTIIAAMKPITQATKQFGLMWEQDLREKLRKQHARSEEPIKGLKTIRLIGEGQDFVVGILHTPAHCLINIQESFGPNRTDYVQLIDEELPTTGSTTSPKKIMLGSYDCDFKRGALLVQAATQNFPSLTLSDQKEYSKLFAFNIAHP